MCHFIKNYLTDVLGHCRRRVGWDGGRGGGGGGHHGEGDVVDEDKEQLGGREEGHLDGR